MAKIQAKKDEMRYKRALEKRQVSKSPNLKHRQKTAIAQLDVKDCYQWVDRCNTTLKMHAAREKKVAKEMARPLEERF